MKNWFCNLLGGAGVSGLAFLILFLSAPAVADSLPRGNRDSGLVLSHHEELFEWWSGADRERDWYDRAYDQYEDGPYGYYDHDHFYDDFDLDYWEDGPEEDEKDWYQEQFRRNYRGGYYDQPRPLLP